ncbi:hypothetical protein [Klenkia brasiliensis]|uniref:Uncharacterized protein n=1 Tax=Klenkia brasiliensis TaxID=333142 RepID=A0A1G7YS15_9ACTN|nr:hypothetical protein [Klenkia brasiliensis]SDG99372.1 hypothetical protein SAMN05660324_4071 [Klenkia brasiliensis]
MATDTLTYLAGAVVGRVRSLVDPTGSASATAGRTAAGWLAVTVLRDPGDVDLASLPAPLAEFGHRIEVRADPAPAGKGTELRARLRDRRPPGPAPARLAGADPEADLRSALRRAKQLLEVGAVLTVDPVPHGRRTATPGGALLEAWTRGAAGAGVR